MKRLLIKNNYPLAEKDFIANQFIIGNGRLGYRGTLEEDEVSERVTFNIVGVYDQHNDKWRESLNLFNPLYLRTLSGFGEENALDHTLTLNLEEGVFSRISKYRNITLSSERFIHKSENIIASKITIQAEEDQTLSFYSGIDTKVYEINGPHYKSVSVERQNDTIYTVKGVTNEGIKVAVTLLELCDNENFERLFDEERGLWKYSGILQKGQAVVITKIATVAIDEEVAPDLVNGTYDALRTSHIQLFSERFNIAEVAIKTSVENLDFYVNYSIYHLLILENEKYTTSIPARGLSGQVYKGAIFWDTEIFMLPFYLVTNPRFARNLIMYRIKTLAGAKTKARTFGYKGAFYAWESQEDGVERCSLYNVSDAKTGAPIRTYFADKQIHISADVIYALNKYLEATNDYSVLTEGGIEVFFEVYKFYRSYAAFKDGQFHFLDVVGPDEYHERVDDNAFTNYQIKYSLNSLLLKIITKPDLKSLLAKYSNIDEIGAFLYAIYLPKPDENGVIEQFTGYFDLENITAKELKPRIDNPATYLGGKDGLATPTRVIKQADVITLLALYPELFDAITIKANYDFYEPYTEHGSSLSNAMYGLVTARLGEEEKALDYLVKSAMIDLTTSYKLWAGGIYIGGTHPASAGGAYLIIKEGFLGLSYNEGVISARPALPKAITAIKLHCYEKNELVKGEFKHD